MCLAALAVPFSVAYLPVFALSSSVYLLYFSWLQGETALEHVGPWFTSPRMCLVLVTRVSFQERERERERGVPNIAFSGEYAGVFLEVVLVQCIIVYTWVASWLGSKSLIWWNLIRPSRQIRNLAIFSCYTVHVAVSSALCKVVFSAPKADQM